MKITKTYDWNRRDFSADIECEGCGHKDKIKSGYDDSNYYNNVVPDMKCKACGKSTNDLGIAPKTIRPKHNPYNII